jgi:hypothetical protein
MPENTILSLFTGRCGHQWVGATGGSYGCPICGLHDWRPPPRFDEEYCGQVEDWGNAWEILNQEGQARSNLADCGDDIELEPLEAPKQIPIGQQIGLRDGDEYVMNIQKGASDGR